MIASVLATVLAGIGWDPTIRGILVVAVGVVVLMGSVYLLLATNTGTRLGFLIALTGFFGWMVIMGLIWWIYGIGLQGEAPTWQVIEVNRGDLDQAELDEARRLDVEAVLEEVGGYEEFRTVLAESPIPTKAALDPLLPGDWEILSPADPSRGEAEATVAAQLPGFGSFEIENPGDYIVQGAFEIGGKAETPEDPNVLERVWAQIRSAAQITHPPRYAVIQVQPVIEQETVVGEAPPTPEADPDAPIISVVMVRDLGDVRFPAAVTTIGSLLIFAVLCYILHQREKVLLDNQERARELATSN